MKIDLFYDPETKKWGAELVTKGYTVFCLADTKEKAETEARQIHAEYLRQRNAIAPDEDR